MATTPNKGYALPEKGAKNWHVDLNGNFTLLDSHVDALEDKDAAFNTESNLVAAGHSATQPATAVGKISLEMKNARGALANLDARLDVSLNEDGTLKTTTSSGDQWPTQGMTTPTYVSASSFKIGGDATGILQPGTSLKVEFATSGTKYLHVKSRSYAAGPNETTVTVWDDETLLNETINAVAWGFVRPNALGAAGTPGSGLRPPEDSSCAIYYYDGAAYDDPWNESGGRVATTNEGHLARVDYASGLSQGVVYASAAAEAPISSIQRKLNLTLVESWTPVYDGGTGLITHFNRS